VLDTARLEEFREFDDEDLTTTREVIALFLDDAPRRLEAIAAAIEAADAPALALAAHALKGAAGNVGAAALQQESAQLEALAQARVPADAAQRLARLRGFWDATREALARWP
jgi:HPt (histidine-containing phosphotransfer) domain-containing protein